MPLFFYLEPEIDSDPLLKDVKEVRVVYKFYLAKNQELADWIKKQQAWEFEQKNFLREKRLQKIKSEGGDSTTLEQEAELDAVLMKEALPDFTLGKLSPNSITN